MFIIVLDLEEQQKKVSKNSISLSRDKKLDIKTKSIYNKYIYHFMFFVIMICFLMAAISLVIIAMNSNNYLSKEPFNGMTSDFVKRED